MTAACRACGDSASVMMTIARQPAMLNYRYRSAATARDAPRADIALAQCASCGLVFNAAFDPGLVHYDDGYENTQYYSPAFLRHLHKVAEDLIERHALRGKSIVEVGCGDGRFLEMLCECGAGSGVGYDSTYRESGRRPGPKTRFVRGYLRPRDVSRPYDAVVCRHVIEHVASVKTFVDDLRAVARAAGDPVVLLETPALEWICEHRAFWDIHYEHCNYFSMPTLSWLCVQAGFDVIDHRLEFEGQYQVLELRSAATPAARRGAGIPPSAAMSMAALAMDRRRRSLEQQLRAAGAAGGWGIWGAGAKGVALANALSSPPPTCLIDSNPAKQGCFVPGLTTPIVAPESPVVKDLEVILIANPNYADEIAAVLGAQGFRNRILTL